MKDIIIVGAGGFGREAYYLIKAINAVKPTWNIKGFLNDFPVDLKEKKIDVPVIGTIKDWEPSDNEVFAMGISSPYGKEKVAQILKSKGAVFATLISPCVYVNSTVEIGEGCIVSGWSIGDCTRLGNFVNIAGSMIGQDRVIGDFSTITGYANVATGDIGKRVFVSSHAVILRDVGDDAFVAAGSVVMSKIKAGSHVMGCPAKKFVPAL